MISITRILNSLNNITYPLEKYYKNKKIKNFLYYQYIQITLYSFYSAIITFYNWMSFSYVYGICSYTNLIVI